MLRNSFAVIFIFYKLKRFDAVESKVYVKYNLRGPVNENVAWKKNKLFKMTRRVKVDEFLSV